MNNKLSFIGSSLGLVGAILISAMYPIYGLSLWLVSNIILGHINKQDIHQYRMYIIYELITIYGLYNYLR
jgi:hypothetical protein